MNIMNKSILGVFAFSALLVLGGCSGSASDSDNSGDDDTGNTPPESNVVSVQVNKGPDGVTNVNLPYVSVKVCTPDGKTCKTIDHVLLDTGSTGLRLLNSALDGMTLPRVLDTANRGMAECSIFISGYTFGSVRNATATLGGLTTPVVPIQVIADPELTSVPATCSSRGGYEMKTVVALGANGILGTGWFAEDCPLCTTQVVPGTYYGCSGSACTATMASLDRQIKNPVSVMATDNNGIMLKMDSVPAAGAATVNGTLYLGIATRTNNTLGSQKVYDLDSSGNFKTTYKGTIMTAFIDTGSNGLFFPDSTIDVCYDNSSAPGFFCPASELKLSATVSGATNGKQGSVSFNIGHAHNLINNTPGNVAFNNIGAPVDWGGQFDWGLPFYYGRTVFIAVEGKDTSSGKGPYIAF